MEGTWSAVVAVYDIIPGEPALTRVTPDHWGEFIFRAVI